MSFDSLGSTHTDMVGISSFLKRNVGQRQSETPFAKDESFRRNKQQDSSESTD